MFTKTQSCETSSQNPFLSRMAHRYILVSSLLFFIFAISSPVQNWDMLGYSASAISIENSDPDYIHNYIYQGLKKYSTDKEYSQLTGGSEQNYQKTMSLDADAFSQQIPYYKIRIIFVALIFFLVKLGINIFLAGHIVSAALTCAGLLFFYYAYKRVVHPLLWVVVPFFFQILGVLDVAQMVTADSLAFFWVGLICFAFMHAYWRSLFILLVISVAVRTDMIVFVALFIGYCLLLRPDLRYYAVICATVSAGTYYGINTFMANYGWSTVFYFAFVSDMSTTHPAELSSPGISMGQYISAVISNLEWFLYDPPVILFGIILFLHFALFWLTHNNTSTSLLEVLFDIARTPVLVLTLLSLIYFVLHYLLFPALWARFFVGQYMIAALGLLSIMTTLIKRDNDGVKEAR